MIRLIFISIMCLMVNSILANDGLSKDAWNELTSEIDFTENFKEAKRDTTPEEKKEPNFTPRQFKSTASIRTVILIVIGIVLLALVVALVLSMSSIKATTNLKTKAHIEDVDDPTEHNLSDLERYLIEALEEGDFRLALRVQFLMLIKALNEKRIINWKKEKTNFDYITELYQKSFQSEFKALVLIFEKSWYANYPINQETYHSALKKFNSIHQTIQS